MSDKVFRCFLQETRVVEYKCKIKNREIFKNVDEFLEIYIGATHHFFIYY